MAGGARLRSRHARGMDTPGLTARWRASRWSLMAARIILVRSTSQRFPQTARVIKRMLGLPVEAMVGATAWADAAPPDPRALSPASTAFLFPPLRKGRPGGVIPAQSITGFSKGLSARPASELRREGWAAIHDVRGVRPHSPEAPLRKRGKGIAPPRRRFDRLIASSRRPRDCSRVFLLQALGKLVGAAVLLQ